MIGRTRLDRLSTIATTSTYLSIEALKLARAEARKGKDVDRYVQLGVWMRQIAGNDYGPDDGAWVDTRAKQVRLEGERLENELKGYKNNLIKESIRVSGSFSNCVQEDVKGAWVPEEEG